MPDLRKKLKKDLSEYLMRRFITLFFLTFTLTGAVMAQMSDDQVIQYVKDGQKSGKNQKQLITELTARGVTKQQAERIKERYEEGQGADVAVVDQSVASQQRERRQDASNEVTAGTFDVISTEVSDPTTKGTAAAARLVFGRNIFNSRNLTFEPNVNMATPPNYRLGPGDEVIIDVWGANEASMRKTISPEGNIMVNLLGPVYLNGMTVAEANSFLKKEFSKIYSQVSGTNPESEVRLTLGQIRSIQINVMGEVAVPGTYMLSSLSTVFHALYRAGGVNNIGSLRSIRVMRGSNCIADLDVYDYILKGKLLDDIRLMEGDVIIVPPYEKLVDISGKVNRPMYYEMKKNETLATLIKYAGGFSGDAYTKGVRLVRQSGREYKLFNIDEMDYSVFHLDDGDAVTVGSILDRFENRVEVRGAVYRSGMYELSGNMNTVKQLIQKAEGLKGDAFLNRAQLFREHEDLTLEVIPIDLKGMMNGSVADIPLIKNDVLVIPSIHELQERGAFTIGGQVARPGTYPYAENTTLEDLIIQAGGLLEAASTVKVDISRRLKDPKGMTSTSRLGEVYTFSVKDGYVVDGTPGFVLEPYDEVIVRRSPAYQVQRKVSVSGEVVFDGGYTLLKKSERLSDLVARSGGLTADAYAKGARLIRRMNDEERALRSATLRMAIHSSGKDSVALGSLALSEQYTVGIELDKALQNPGSDYDMVLREGDQLIIPEYLSTVRINGEVMYPNTVLYKKGAKLGHYIDQAGGYGARAKKSKAYIVYMNGTVSRVKRLRKAKVEPGCEIIIPTKRERKRVDIAQIIGLTTSAASIGTMAATVANLLKK